MTRLSSIFSARQRCRAVSMVCWLVAATTGVAQTTVEYFDTPADARLLRFDGGTNGPALPINFVHYEIGAWQPDDAQASLFRGQWVDGADFFRVTLSFSGLVNPPGLDINNLFSFGPNPLLGFMEFDMDADRDSGGEVAGADFRYQGNVARLGGLPTAPRFQGRIAQDGCPGNYDLDITTGPYFPERSGEEFHLAFLYSQVTALDVGSNGDLSFDPGETWVVSGHFFHRAHGFDDFILLCCSNGLPSYNPVVDLLWQHIIPADRTEVSLVYPLTPAGAAAINHQPIEPTDCCADNQNDVLEALEHLSLSAQFASTFDRSQPNFALLAPWEFKAASAYLDPTMWQLTLITVSAFVDPDTLNTVLAWTDAAPDVLAGDFNGDGMITPLDGILFDEFLLAADGDTCDVDGIVDGVVTLGDFGTNFNMHDLNYDGVVDASDRPTSVPTDVSYDADGDGDVDLVDFAAFQRCFGAANQSGFIPPECVVFDSNADGAIGMVDLAGFGQALSGPIQFSLP